MDIENHPIPQDITGFQFKLVGNMTLKQFGFLAAGFVIAWVFYISPLFLILKIVFAVLSAAAGASLAFVPIDGRPMDVMIVYFIKAAFKPTQYVYQQADSDLGEKEAKSIHSFNKKRQTIAEMSDQQLQEFLNTLPKGTSPLDKKEMVFFQNVNQYQSARAQAPMQNLPGFVAKHAYANSAPQAAESTQKLPSLPQARIEQATPTQTLAPTTPTEIPRESAQQTVIMQEKQPERAMLQQEQQEVNNPPEYLAANQKVLELQQNLNDMLLQKQQLEEKLTQLQQQAIAPKQTIYSPSGGGQQAQHQNQPQQTNLVRSVPQNMTKSVGLIATPEFPNVISGIIKDPRGNPLPNILVEVKDSQGHAARAFKTNALGQFASATALSNGDYTIEFEDPKGQNKFVAVGFKAAGEIILPIEVISVDTREELRRSLFN
jgi:hypothetical protein